MGNLNCFSKEQDFTITAKTVSPNSKDTIDSMFSNLVISEEKSCIHLMCQKGGIPHAFLIVESVQRTPEGSLARVLTHAGFGPTNDVKNTQMLMCNSKIDVFTWKYADSDPTADSDEEMRQYFTGVEKHPSWCVPSCVGESLLQIIQHSENNLKQTAYTVTGDSSTTLVKKVKRGTEGNENCASWAVAMLKELRNKHPDAGITSKVNWVTNFPVDIPPVILWILRK